MVGGRLSKRLPPPHVASAASSSLPPAASDPAVDTTRTAWQREGGDGNYFCGGFIYVFILLLSGSRFLWFCFTDFMAAMMALQAPGPPVTARFSRLPSERAQAASPRKGD